MVVSHHAAVEWVMPVWMASPAQFRSVSGSSSEIPWPLLVMASGVSTTDRK